MRYDHSHAAWQVNRDLAARDERDAVVAFLRGEIAALNDDDQAHCADLLRALAMCIEAGDHRR